MALFYVVLGRQGSRSCGYFHAKMRGSRRTAESVRSSKAARVVSLLVRWWLRLVAYRAARSGASAARRDSKGGAPPHSAGFSAKADSNRSREAARLGSGVGRSTHSTVERAELHIIGAGFGVLVMWALRGGATAATSAIPGTAATLPASAPNWRQAEPNLERAPQVRANLESTSESWSQPGVALKNLESAPKTWSELTPTGASSLQLERARSELERSRSDWSERKKS